LIGDPALLLGQLTRLILSARQPFFHCAVATLAQQTLRALQFFLSALGGLLLLVRVPALRLLLHVLCSLLKRACGVGHLTIVIFAGKFIELTGQAFSLALEFLRGHLFAAATAAALLLLAGASLLQLLLTLGQFLQFAQSLINFL
jgi:hypothetical protein